MKTVLRSHSEDYYTARAEQGWLPGDVDLGEKKCYLARKRDERTFYPQRIFAYLKRLASIFKISL